MTQGPFSEALQRRNLVRALRQSALGKYGGLFYGITMALVTHANLNRRKLWCLPEKKPSSSLRRRIIARRVYAQGSKLTFKE